MKIRFLRMVDVPMKSTRYCGDGCCSYPEWNTATMMAGEEATDVVTESTMWCMDGSVNIGNLKYREDYEILEFP